MKQGRLPSASVASGVNSCESEAYDKYKKDLEAFVGKFFSSEEQCQYFFYNIFQSIWNERGNNDRIEVFFDMYFLIKRQNNKIFQDFRGVILDHFKYLHAYQSILQKI